MIRKSSETVKIVVFVPISHADRIRTAIGNAGAGKLGNYDFNSFSLSGTGRWRTLKGAKPFIGKAGMLSEEVEERIEFWCERKIAKKAIKEIKRVHPYEVPAIDIYPLLSEKDL